MSNTGESTERALCAQRWAYEAGNKALKVQANRDNLDREQKASPIDYVTEVDKSIEAWLVTKIESEFPEDGIWGEEDARKTSASGFTWVIDPIDGTREYTNGSPLWSVSVGIVEGTTPAAGVVYAPLMGHPDTPDIQGSLYVGVVGKGSIVNNVKINPTDRTDYLNRIAAFDPWTEEQLPDGTKFFAAKRPAGNHLGGSAALCLVMAGAHQAEVYIKSGLAPHDYLAAVAICEAAGVKVTTRNGKPITFSATATNPTDVFAAVPNVHEPLLGKLNQPPTTTL